MREFNQRLREQFDAFVVNSDASAVPIWKLEMPDPLARHLADTLDAPDVDAYIERRVTELGLPDDTLTDTLRDTQAQWHSAVGRPGAAVCGPRSRADRRAPLRSRRAGRPRHPCTDSQGGGAVRA